MSRKSLAVMLPVVAALCSSFGGQPASAAPVVSPATALSRYVFTDQWETIRLTNPIVGPVSFTEKVITTAGWGPTKSGSVPVIAGAITIAPLSEGINVVTLSLDSSAEVRFLAMDPPLPLDRSAILKSLPINGEKLVDGKPWKFDALGDSVTSTGDYPGMLKMLLARATGNKNITFVNRAKFGMTTDYTVRMFSQIVTAEHPDAAFIMYGLNDQRNYAPDAYIKQYQWLGTHIRSDVHADPVFLQPTTDFSIPGGTAVQTTNPAWYAFRTIGYATWLSQTGKSMDIPVANTFDAIWGKGGTTIADAAHNDWPILPRDFNDQLSTMLESNGNGDPVHVNALGQLQIAKSVYSALDGIRSPWRPLHIYARSEWTAVGLVSHVTVLNVGSTLARLLGNDRSQRAGFVRPYPLMASEVATVGDGAYSLNAGQSMTFDVTWRKVATPGDLTKFPNLIYLCGREPLIPIVDFSNGECHVYSVKAPFSNPIPGINNRRTIQESAHIDLPTVTVNGVRATVTIDGARVDAGNYSLPPNVPVGRISEVISCDAPVHPTYAAAEVAYARFGRAVRGDATIDGDLGEWAGADWIPVGKYPTQARWIKGPEDYRASPQECYAELSLKAGKSGVYIAGKVTGSYAKDSFILYFDPRSPNLLGTPGTYYWLSARFNPDGTLAVSPGETSPGVDGLVGKWKATDTGATFEIFAPYGLFDATDWPSSGDLGFSCWWQHTGPTGKVTNLMWLEDGFPWTPLWYGVVRLEDGRGKPLPYVVRVK